MKKEKMKKRSMLTITTALMLVLLFCFAGSAWADDINKQIAKSSTIDKVMRMAKAGRKVREDIMVICHGGPFDEPLNVGKALAKMPGIVGFFGASSIERLPTERAIRGQVEAFKSLRLA